MCGEIACFLCLQWICRKYLSVQLACINGGISIVDIGTAILFALQSAVLSVILEWAHGPLPSGFCLRLCRQYTVR